MLRTACELRITDLRNSINSYRGGAHHSRFEDIETLNTVLEKLNADSQRAQSQEQAFPVFTVDPDQPVQCPHCGARTEFTEINELQQEHRCLNPLFCGAVFITEFDTEADEEE